MMNASVQAISPLGLLSAFARTVIVMTILYRWALDAPAALHAVARMLIQLLLIGYVLTYIFQPDHAGMIVCLANS